MKTEIPYLIGREGRSKTFSTQSFLVLDCLPNPTLSASPVLLKHLTHRVLSILQYSTTVLHDDIIFETQKGFDSGVDPRFDDLEGNFPHVYLLIKIGWQSPGSF